MTNEDRLQQLEALLDRVRRRATEARRPIARLFATEPTRSEPRRDKPVLPPVREIVREPVVAAPPPPPVPAPPIEAPPPVAPAAFAPFTVVPATLELVDTPPPEALGEDDLLDEIPSDMLESVPPSGGTVERDTLDESIDQEEPPASSQRPRAAAALLDDALASEPLLDEGREVPLKTPPPESGPQEAPIPAGFGAPHAPDLDHFEAELPPVNTSSGVAASGSTLESLEQPFGTVSMQMPAAAGPTVEQLGQTIELEEGGAGPTLELDAPATPPPPAPPKAEELEVPLPVRESAGRYDDELMPPPEAREDLDAHREKVGDSLAPEPEAASATPFAELSPSLPAASVVNTMPAIGELPIAEFSPPPGPEIVGRPPLESGVVFTVKPSEQRPVTPTTFLELLDTSIALGG